MVRKVSLVCGILFSLLYVGRDILGAIRCEGYSHASPAAGELEAISTPVRRLGIALLITYSLFATTFFILLAPGFGATAFGYLLWTAVLAAGHLRAYKTVAHVTLGGRPLEAEVPRRAQAPANFHPGG